MTQLLFHIGLRRLLIHCQLSLSTVRSTYKFSLLTNPWLIAEPITMSRCHPPKTKTEPNCYCAPDITFTFPSESWEHLSSMPLLLRWETESLLEPLARPVNIDLDWKDAPNIQSNEVPGDQDVALEFDLKTLDFTTEQLGIMAQFNKEMQED